MSTQVFLHLPEEIHKAIWSHLLPPRPKKLEEAAFLFVRQGTGSDGTLNFHHAEWLPVPAEGFESRSAYHFELTDAMRGSIIKRAHDLRCSVVELHSHVGPWPAEFSPSDLAGFREFVPHVWWRLKGRPYLAVVVCKSGFDAFAWVSDPRTPQHLDGIVVGETLARPTKLSSFSVDFNGE